MTFNKVILESEELFYDNIYRTELVLHIDIIYLNEIQMSHPNGECMLLIEDPEYRKKISKNTFRKNVTNVSFDRTSRKL